MKYTIPIAELNKRVIIRNDQCRDFLNKMTNEEIDQFYKELKENLIENNTINEPFAEMCALTDRDILCKIFQEFDQINNDKRI